MRSLIVPVSLSSLLFPTVAPGCSGSFLSFSLFALDGGGSAVGGFCGSVCCAKAGEATAHKPINKARVSFCRSFFCLFMVPSNYLPRARHSSPFKSYSFQNARLPMRFFTSQNGFFCRSKTAKTRGFFKKARKF